MQRSEVIQIVTNETWLCHPPPPDAALLCICCWSNYSTTTTSATLGICIFILCSLLPPSQQTHLPPSHQKILHIFSTDTGQDDFPLSWTPWVFHYSKYPDIHTCFTSFPQNAGDATDDNDEDKHSQACTRTPPPPPLSFKHKSINYKFTISDELFSNRRSRGGGCD